MKTKINVNGDVHIPSIMRKNIGIKNGQDVEIECRNNKIIISNISKIRSREEIKGFLADLQKYNDDISKGMKQMAEWVLYEDTKSVNEKSRCSRCGSEEIEKSDPATGMYLCENCYDELYEV